MNATIRAVMVGVSLLPFTVSLSLSLSLSLIHIHISLTSFSLTSFSLISLSHLKGYPDIITDLDGKIYITETYKSTPQSEAKTHAVDMNMISMLYNQRTINSIVTSNIIAHLNVTAATFPTNARLPNFYKYEYEQYGFSLDMWINPSSLPSKCATPASLVSALSDHRTTGFFVDYYRTNGTVRLTMMDTSNHIFQFGTDPTCSKRLLDPHSEPHHVGIIVDGGPKMISFVVDGKLCDGGPSDLQHWPNGHTLMDFDFGDMHINAVGVESSVKTNLDVVENGHLYNRSLYVTEMIGNWRAGL